jgi:glutamate-1-semialdehyde aminotransferase
MTDGGVYKLTQFRPDIVVYGKAMGNGFAISAVLGSKKVMDVCQESFMSSTFWTERVGFAAAIATISKLTRYRVWQHLISIGELIGEGWEKAAHRHGLRLHVTNFKPLVTFKLDYGGDNQALYTLFTQEMLRRGYLAASSVYVSYAHTPKIVAAYLGKVDEVFGIMAKALSTGRVRALLRTPIRSEGFTRLT